MRSILIVANLTLGGQALDEVVRDRAAQGGCRFHVIVPASHAPLSGTYTHEDNREAAQQRLDRMLDRLDDLGCEATGEVGDIRAIDATIDAVRHADYDEVVVSTLPVGVSRWLRLDLPRRIERALDVPVTHVEGEPIPV